MALPVGSIILWQNSIESLPDGWQICDGTNGTPDLREFFVYGASVDGDVGSNQASASHNHARPANTSNDGGHQHSINVSVGNSSGSVDVRNVGTSGANAAGNGHGHSGISGTTSGATGAHSHTVGGNTGNETVLPPYMYLFYVMRVV